jgi:hypothetical protein
MRAPKMTWLRMMLPVLLAVSSAPAVGCSGSGSSSEDSASASTAAAPLTLTDGERRDMVSKKTTCPFVGTALALKKILLFGTKDTPLARIVGDGSIGAVGDTGGGDLSLGFRVVARGNHHKSPNGTEAPDGMFSLDFPNSLGAHPAHSFILMGNPRTANSGRLDENNLGRLTALQADGGHAELAANGSLVVRRSELGRFISRNVTCDRNSVVNPWTVATLLGKDISEFTDHGFDAVRSVLDDGSADSSQITQLIDDLVRIAVQNSLVASVGEFGLLTMFLAPSPNTVTMDDGEPALAVDDITGMFAGKKDPQTGKYDPLTRTFPPGWGTTPRTNVDFLRHSVFVLRSAALSYMSREFRRDATCPTDMQ